MKDLLKMFRNPNIETLSNAIQIGLVTKSEVRNMLDVPSISLIEDVEYFQKKVWKSFALPKHYLLPTGTEQERPQPSVGSIRTEGKFGELQVWQGTEWTNLKGRTVSDEGYFYAPYIPYIKDTYVNDVKVEARSLFDNVLEIDLYLKPVNPATFITLNISIGETAADRYDRAMKVVE